MNRFSMRSLRAERLNPKFIFYTFCLVHLLIWTLGPLLVRTSLSNDVAEGIAWGYQWQLGYNKHPPLAAWLLAIATRLGGDPEWPVYLLAQILLLSGFWAVWRLAGKMLSPWPALVAVMLLEGIIFYNVKSVTFTPDTLQMPIWAFITLFYYLALSSRRRIYWLWVGLFAGLAVLTKYQAVVLFVAMFAVLLMTAQGRSSLKTSGPYQAVLIGLLITAPHFYWSWQLHFPEIHYALRNVNKSLDVVANPSFWYQHLVPPVLNLKNTLATLLPVAVLSAFLYSKERGKTSVVKWQRDYILLMALTPYLVTLLASLITGGLFAARWNIPDFYLLGLLIMLWMRPPFRPQQIRRFLVAFLVLFLLIPAVRFGYIQYRAQTWTVRGEYFRDFPAREVAGRVQILWEQYSTQPLRYVAGRHYLVAFVAAYADRHPAAYFDWDPAQSAYIDEAKMRRAGAVFLWTVENDELQRLPAAIRKRFPKAIELPVMAFRSDSGGPVRFRIGVALLPPAVF